jgi:hypothetical protein
MRLAGNRAEVGECCARTATQVKVKLCVAPIRKFNGHPVKRERMGSSGNIQIFSNWRFSERLQPPWGSLTITASAGVAAKFLKKYY